MQLLHNAHILTYIHKHSVAGKGSQPFTADAIISNPVTYGHIHCAEARHSYPIHTYIHNRANLKK